MLVMPHHLAKEFYSPDGRLKCVLGLRRGSLYYRVFRDDAPLIRESRLGFKFRGADPLSRRLRFIRTRITRHEGQIELPWGEDHIVGDTYTEAVFHFAESTPDSRHLILRFRVYNDTVAFRYELPIASKIRRLSIDDELTEFNLDPDTLAWHIPAYQPDRYEYCYTESPVYSLTRSVHTPLTLRTPGGTYLSIHEAALYDYGSMTIKLNHFYRLQADITPLSDGTRAHIELPFKTPWRLIMVADSAIGLTENRTMFALNPPAAHDFSWVKTLKFIGIWWAMYVGEWTWAPGERHGATTAHALSYINSAVALGIRGLLIEGWNDGWEGDWLKNGKNNKFTTATPDFSLVDVAKYADFQGIELVGHHETVGFIDNYESQLEDAYAFYESIGVHYVKTGYAGPMMTINGRKEYHHSQIGVNHYQYTVEAAARHHICLDIHEPIKGTGIERTWPNLLSREGARGQEYEGGSLNPSHACFLPFTRLLSGGMDYTNGIFDLENPVKHPHTTVARQLAYFVTIYSGMAMAADRPLFYEQKYPDLFNFIRDVPTTFERTVPLAGEIGQYYIVARKARDDSTWFIGGVTDASARDFELPLDFLSPRSTYLATIYTDAPEADYRTNPLAYRISEQKLTAAVKLPIHLAPGGGFAAKLTKI